MNTVLAPSRPWCTSCRRGFPSWVLLVGHSCAATRAHHLTTRKESV